MTQVLRLLPKTEPVKEVLVGNETADDAGVYQLTDDIALVQSLDYFTPIVDDPYMFGQIAAANALSDIYAMGGTPKTALNLVGFPIGKLGPEMLASILKGAADKVTEAGAVTIGGHSIEDQEPKFGLSITGTIHPSEIWKNAGARPGDALVLTKPIGVGIMTTGIKRQAVTAEQEALVTSVMATLNKQAAELLASYNVHSVTDITGFGLLGHAGEMAKASGVSMVLEYSSIPILPGTEKLAEAGIVPGGSKSNHAWIACDAQYSEAIGLPRQLIVCDAVTSGGLLISMPKAEAERYAADLREHGNSYAAVIGEVTEKQEKYMYVK